MLDLRKLDLSKAVSDGEKASLRHVRFADDEDLTRLWEIENHDSVRRYVEDLSEDFDELLYSWVVQPHYLPVVVEGKAGYVDDSEVGKLQGWLMVYPDDKRRLKRLSQTGLFDQGTSTVFEIGFAKYPKAKSGQIASALRQLVKLLFEKSRELGLEVVLTAYSDETNEASRRVLDAAGFNCRGKIKYRVKNKTEDYFFAISKGLDIARW